MYIGYRIVNRLFNFKTNTFGKTKNICSGTLECNRNYCKSRYKLVKKTIVSNTVRKMKIDSPQFKSVLTEEVNFLKDLFVTHGHEIKIVGGAVRDLLLGLYPTDLDFATTATPNEMKDLFTDNNIRMLNTNGERHGTITVRINERNFEITTLRIDVLTNGRHSEVEFTKNWVLDANRRDLTINSLYLGLDGTLYDYCNGYEDLKKRRVVFVGNAAERIQEDYLRILRYFRFYGKISEVPDNHDQDVIKAIRDNVDGLSIISGERIKLELDKILTGNFVTELFVKILDVGIGPHISLPTKCNLEELKKVSDRLKKNDFSVKPMTLLASIFYSQDEMEKFCARIKPSAVERELLFFIFNERFVEAKLPDPLKYYQVSMLSKPKQYIFFVFELLKYNGDMENLKQLEKWDMPKFPVNGHMLMEKGIKGKKLGIILNKLKEIWIQHDFNISAEDLLEQMSDNFIQTPPKKQKIETK